MSGPSPLFVTGIARGGTTLVARILDAATGVGVASDPYLPLYRLLRTALVRTAGLPADPATPFEDYYFTDERIARLDAVQQGDLACAIDPGELEVALNAVAQRVRLEAPELEPLVERIGGATGREVFDSALAGVAEVSGAERFAGTKEVWTIEFVAPLARAHPDARFVLVLRDPRGVLASLAALAAKDPSQAAHPLSYARHWRKAVAFAERYRGLADVSQRLHVIRYEDLVRTPEREVRALCGFLDLPYDDSMITPAWAGNSSFGELAGIDPAPAEKWRTELDPGALAMAELVCGPEMELAGYEPAAEAPSADAALAHLAESDGWEVSWRSDLGDPALDHERELERRSLLHARDPDPAEVRRDFLFSELYEALPARQAARERWTEPASTP